MKLTFVISKNMIFIGSDDLTKCVHSRGWVNRARGSQNSVSNAKLVGNSDKANPYDSQAFLVFAYFNRQYREKSVNSTRS